MQQYQSHQQKQKLQQNQVTSKAEVTTEAEGSTEADVEVFVEYWVWAPVAVSVEFKILAEFTAAVLRVVTMATVLFWGATWFIWHRITLLASCLNFLSFMTYTMIFITAFNAMKETMSLKWSSVMPHLFVHSIATHRAMETGHQLMMKPTAIMANKRTTLDLIFKFCCLRTFCAWLPSWNKASDLFLIVCNVKNMMEIVKTDTIKISNPRDSRELSVNRGPPRLQFAVVIFLGASSKKNTTL